MNHNISNPRLTLRWLHPLLITHWMEWRGCSLNVNLRPWWYWTPRSDWRQGMDMREATPSMDIMLSLRWECRTKALRGTGESNRLQIQTRWNWRNHASLRPFQFPHYVNLPRLRVAPGDSWPMRSSPLILIPCIITFIHFHV